MIKSQGQAGVRGQSWIGQEEQHLVVYLPGIVLGTHHYRTYCIIGPSVPLGTLAWEGHPLPSWPLTAGCLRPRPGPVASLLCTPDSHRIHSLDPHSPLGFACWGWKDPSWTWVILGRGRPPVQVPLAFVHIENLSVAQDENIKGPQYLWVLFPEGPLWKPECSLSLSNGTGLLNKIASFWKITIF